jgi:hypothetical protein
LTGGTIQFALSLQSLDAAPVQTLLAALAGTGMALAAPISKPSAIARASGLRPGFPIRNARLVPFMPIDRSPVVVSALSAMLDVRHETGPHGTFKKPSRHWRERPDL